MHLSRPVVVASAVCLFMLLSGAQAFFWPGRPPVGWQPAWWQSQIWATLGFLIFVPSALLVAILQEGAGIWTPYVLMPAFVIGIGAVIVVPTWLAFRMMARREHRGENKA